MSRPNIVLIFTDQQRFDTIHAAGNPVIRTPNLDRLVHEGVYFSSAFTPSPVCVSARCSLIHGQYPSRTGCSDNGYPMPTDRPTLMSMLSEAGYRTHGVGKMHFTPDSQALRGFQSREHSEEIRSSVQDDDYIKFLHENGFEHVYDPMGPRGEMYYIPQPAQMPARLHNTNWVGDRSVGFIRSETGSSQPFFLFASFIHPHPPFSAPTPWNKLYRGALMPLPKRPPQSEALHTYINKHQNRYKYRDNGIDDNLLRVIKAYYYACISFVDYQVGKMLSALEDAGQLDNTLIIYTSDHGEFLGDYGCFGKRSMLDSAARIPLLARFPQRFAAGESCPLLASLVDVMPTLLSVAGLPVGESSLSGIDLADLASSGVDGPHSERTVHSQYQSGAMAVHMAVDRRWKYVYSSPDRREFVFDREQDPEETRSRAGLVFCAKPLREMRERALEHYRDAGVTECMDGDGWRLYPQPALPEDPDAGLLIQDAPWAEEFQAIPGYSD